MTRSELKEKLLSISLVEDNEFLEKYLDIICDNFDTKKRPFETQQHHIIPRYYYKYTNQELNNNKSNIVNLIYKNHILAHYYLMHCSTHNSLYRRANACAIQRLIRALKRNNRLETNWIDSLEEIQTFYEESKHINYFKSDTKEKIRNACLGSVFLYKDGVYKYIKTENLDEWFKEGWVQKHPPQSEESKQKLREKAIGKIYINKDGCIKRILPEELEYYESLGFVKGQGPRKCESYLKGKIGIIKDGHTKYISESEFDSYQSEGWQRGGLNKGKHFQYHPRTPEANERIAQSRRGKIAIHKNKIIKYVDEALLPEFLSDGWIRGTGTKTKSATGKIWINNGTTSIYIDPPFLDEYINNGWKRGRAPLIKGGDDLL